MRLGFERERESVRPRCDHGGTHGELPEATFASIASHVEAARDALAARRYQQARRELADAYARLPEPVHAWNVAGWLLAALGECAWQLGEPETAKKLLSNALNAPGTVGNAFIHMRFGQALHEIDDPRARYELVQARRIGGPCVFEAEEPIYSALAIGGDVTSLLPSVPEEFFTQIEARLEAHASSHPTHDRLDVALVLLDLRQLKLVDSALAGERIGVVLGSSPRPQAPGSLESAGDPSRSFDVLINGVVHPRGRIVLCRGVVREGVVRAGDRVRWVR